MNTPTDDNTFSVTEAVDSFNQILSKVTGSTARNEPVALAIVGNYREPSDADATISFQHVQGNTTAISSAVRALIRGTFEHYKSDPEFQKAFRLDILKITDKYFMPGTPVDNSRVNMAPQIKEILKSADTAMKSSAEGCRIVASGVANGDGTIRVQQVCEGQVGPLAVTIADIICGFVHENQDEPRLLSIFQREVNRAFEAPTPSTTTPN